MPPSSTALAALCATLYATRRRAGLSQQQLAELMNRSQSWVHKIEVGERAIDPVECVEWARACRVSPRAFFVRFTDALSRKI